MANRMLDVREERGRLLAQVAKIDRVGRHWVVPSQTSPAQRYLVNIEENMCTCPDYGLHKGTCKHMHAVLYWIAWGRDVANSNTALESDVTQAAAPKKRKTYAQEWSAYNASQRHEREYVERLAKALCAGIVQPPRNPGVGRNRCQLSDLVFGSAIKVYRRLSSRRMHQELKDYAGKGYITRALHENSIGKFLNDPESTPLLVSLIEEAASPLRMIENGQYAIDSTGFATCSYYRYYDVRDKKLKIQGDWIKLHIVGGTASHGITAVSVSPKGDVTQLRELLTRTMKRHEVLELSADKAYGSLKNHELLEESGVEAFIPFKDNAVINTKSEVWSRHLCKFILNKDKFLPHYHRRSNVETIFSMIKRVLGPSVASKNPTAQLNELLAKCLAHNLRCLVKAIFVSGLAPTFWSDAPVVPTLTLVKP